MRTYPYLVMLAIFKSGIDDETSTIKNLRQVERYLPDNIYTALADFVSRVDHRTAGRGLERSLCGPEAGRCRPLSAPARHVCEARKCSTTTTFTTNCCGICSKPLQFRDLRHSSRTHCRLYRMPSPAPPS